MFNATLTDLSRFQFALTAMYHWIFVPLTLGLGFIIAFMETKYVRSGDDFWKKAAKFWMKIFAVNFAIGVATGIILEFEFGTNWSNYSWFVGDIFGAPLAIEGIFAFFMESTFFAVMFFGWDKVGKKAHLAATWLTAIGTNLSAIWILIANSWMQYPVGMEFNPDTARNEMTDFWAVVFSPVAINKIIHTVTNAYVLSSVAVIGISSWYLLKRKKYNTVSGNGDADTDKGTRIVQFSRKSISIASVFGLVSLIILIWSGDGSAYRVAKHQPMKLAAMEGLYDGQHGTPLVAMGILNPDKTIHNDEDPMLFEISIPQGLSILANRETGSFVPGINDIIRGGYEYIDRNGNRTTAPSFEEAKAKGLKAINALGDYTQAKETGNTEMAVKAIEELEENFDYFGYGYLDKPEDLVPHVPLVFYAFRVMVLLGGFFLLYLLLLIFFNRRNTLESRKWMLWLGIISVPLVYICSQAGWIVAEVGRQPWTIQNLLPVNAAVSGNSTTDVTATIVIFAILFTTLLVAELKIMFNVIKKGPAM